MKIHRTRKPLLCAIALATLSLVALPSSADNGAYGYSREQDYPDRFEGQRRYEHRHQQFRPIHILEARYGLRGASCDARDSLQEAVGRHRYVSVAINNNLCGDPLPGVPKRIRITYRCDTGEIFEVRAPERGVATLDCK